MKLTMNERGAVIKGFAQQCRRAGKKRKGRILVVGVLAYVSLIVFLCISGKRSALQDERL